MGQLGNSSKVTSSQGQVTLSNGSLLLQHSGLRDRGLYQCRVNSTGEKQGSDIAPIRAVSIELAENKLLCSTRGVYPAPLLQWGTDPPSKLDARLIITSMRANNQGLYDSESSLSLQEQSGPNRYVCTVRSKHGSQTWTASVAEGKPLLIPCVVPKNLENFTLTWMFTRTKGPTVILTYNSLTHQTSGPWDGQVAMDPDQVLLGNVSLRVLSPMNKDNVGHYTCTFSGFQTSYVIQTALTISTTSTGWVIGVVVGLLALVIVGVVIHQKRKGKELKQGASAFRDSGEPPRCLCGEVKVIVKHGTAHSAHNEMPSPLVRKCVFFTPQWGAMKGAQGAERGWFFAQWHLGSLEFVPTTF
uniref:Ig-like domain-containing protein n=1 Tax=Denticeps clupeoides TaxID=299321 RepID=A0AAY4A1W9_9TELE